MPPTLPPYRSPTTTLPHHNQTYPYIHPHPPPHHPPLTGKIALITGASRGIGRATALAFAAAGAHVACLSRSHADVAALVAVFAERGYPLGMAIEADVREGGVGARVVGEVEAGFGLEEGKGRGIDVLVNNAGVSWISDVAHGGGGGGRAWEVVEVNLRGTMEFVGAVVPGMLARGSGVVINVVSVLAAVSLPYFAAYSAAKAGVVRATAVWALECRPRGVFVYAVHPGMVAETTLGVGALDERAAEGSEGVRRFMEEFVPSMGDSVDLPADTMVALVVDGDAKLLAGKYVDCTQDLGEVLAEARKGAEGRIEREGLYQLKVDTL